MSSFQSVSHPALHALFHFGFKPGRISLDENGKGIVLTPDPNESVFFFNIDQEDDLIDALGLANKKRCDALMLYLRETTVRLVAIEFKGRDHLHAVKQIAETLRALKERLPPFLTNHLFTRVVLGAVVVSPYTPIQQLKPTLENFHKKWQITPLFLDSYNEPGLRRYLNKTTGPSP